MVNPNYKNRFIRIIDARLPSYKTMETRMRSLEKYLEKNNREYELHEEVFTVYVDGKADAMNLGVKLHLNAVSYFNGREFQSISLSQKNKTGRPKNMVFDEAGKGMTLRQFKKKTITELRTRCLTKSEIVKAKILTRSTLKQAIKHRQLNEIKMGKIIYIDRQELVRMLSGQQTLGL